MTTRKKLAKKKSVKKAVTGKRSAKKTTARKKLTKKKSARKTTARKKLIKKKSTKKKATRKKSVKKAVARKKSAKKTARKKSVKKTAARKKLAKRKSAKETTARKKSVKKAASKKRSAKKTTARKKLTKKRAGSETKAAARMISSRKANHHSKGSGVYLTQENLDQFKSQLLCWKKELMEEIDRTVVHMQHESNYYADINDRATHEEEFGRELKNRDRERKLTKKINDALTRIESHQFGYCEECGAEIGKVRLKARPTATMCVDCKALAEILELKS